MRPTDAPSPLHNVGAWTLRWARIAPDHPALADAERSLDYCALHERTGRCAALLAARGVGPGDRVALLLGNRTAYLELVLGAARLGAIAVPVNARFTAPEIRRVLVDCTPSLTLVGRARDMYISGGENVYPAEVEAAYAEHPAIDDIAIVGVPDPRWGEIGRAFVVLRDGARLDADALRRWGAERLAGFKLPREFVAVASLPRTETGKVQRHQLDAAPRDPAGR